MRFKLPSQYTARPNLAQVIFKALLDNGVSVGDGGVSVGSDNIIVADIAGLNAAQRQALKTVVLANVEDTSTLTNPVL